MNIIEKHKKETFLRTFNSKGVDQLDLLHCALGITGEAGEIIDYIKKKYFYTTQPVNTIKLTEEEIIKLENEIGDLLYYIQGLTHLLSSSLDECMEKNIEKLAKRYPEKFSLELSQKKLDEVKS